MLKLNEFVKKYDKALFILGLVVIALLMLGFTNAFADNIITYGKSTYNQVGGSIIFGSLGDEYAVSEFGKLGNNDFIPENAFKNTLGYEGYSVAYDYNPTYDGYYPEAYNEVLPIGVDLTKIQIAGLGANSREIQDVYVLTKEYDRLSAQGQAISIDNLNSGLSSETTNRISGDNILQNNINVVDNNSISRDNTLQTNINNEATTRATADNNLQSNITNVNSRVDDVSNRVSRLEATQYVVKTELKFIREKHLEVGIYAEYNAGRNVCSEVGLNVVIPIGNSYLDRENKKINARLDRLEQKISGATIIERTLDKKGKVKSISISQGQLQVNGSF